MIFLTTGSELPFNRLTQAVDEWCKTRGRSDVFGQVGSLGPDDYAPSHFEWSHFVEPEEYTKRFKEASLIVAHAGMGSIISALTERKPIFVLPRLKKYRETRSDHQVATLKRFGDRTNIFGVWTEEEVPDALDRVLEELRDFESGTASAFADEKMTNALRAFILEGKYPD